MAFDPLYAVGPGRPVNLRDIDPSIVGQQLQQSYDGLPANPQASTGSEVPGYSPYQPTMGQRIEGAVASFGANTDPNSVYAPEQFFGSAARGFAGVKTYLNNLRQQHAEGQRQSQKDDLEKRNIESQIRERDRVRTGQVNSPRVGESKWISDPDDPARELSMSKNPTTGEWSIDTFPDGRQMVRPKATDRARNIDPNSEEGIAAAVDRAGRVALATLRAAPNVTIAQARAYATRAEQASPEVDTVPLPTNAELEAGLHTPFDNFGKSQAYRLWRTKALAFIYPILRKETGAGIRDEEFVDAVDMYVPKPGDGPAVLAAKRLNRERSIAGLHTMGNTASEAPSDYTPPPE